MCTYEQRSVSLGFTDEKFQVPLHMCYIYKDDDERMKTLAKFIQNGVGEGDKVFYFVDTMSMDDMKDALVDLGIEKRHFEDTTVTLADAKATYLPDGTFNPDEMLKTVKKVYQDAMNEGVNMRNTGEMSWVLDNAPGTEHLIEYEAKINLLTREVPINGICQYDARIFDGATIMDVLAVHPYSIVAGQLVKNPFYTPPEEFLKNYPKSAS